MTERDPKVSQRYRELGGEEPPRALDDAILAASRRSVQKRSWNRPIAIAAVIVLAVAVTVHVQREQPAEELVTASRTESPPATAAIPAPESARKRVEPERPRPAPPRAFTPDPGAQPAPQQSAGTAADLRERQVQRDSAPAELRKAPVPATAPAPAAVEDRALARQDASERAAAASLREESSRARVARQADAVSAVAGARSAASTFAYASPEQWLLGIDDLKRQGKHDEAEKQLAEFRKRYPGYRIPEAITEKFERR